VVVRLLAAGAPPDAVDARGRSALHEVCSNGHVRAASALLEGGADPNLGDKSGRTPLHIEKGELIQHFDPALEQLLLAHGADPSVLSSNGLTPRMTASGLTLQPAPDWGAVEQALETAAGADEQTLPAGARAACAVHALLPQERGGLRALQLFDLLWCEHSGDLLHDAPSWQLLREMRGGELHVARRRLIFEQLIAPLVREAPTRKLEAPEKALLIKACQATAGWQLGAEDLMGDQEPRVMPAREGHRKAFDELLRATMAQFAEQLGTEYDALAAQPGGAMLLALPATELLNGVAEEGLRQDAPAVGGTAPWLDAGTTLSFEFHKLREKNLAGALPKLVADGDLVGAFRCALAPAGALDSPEALCDLLQGGRHPLLKESRPKHFNGNAEPVPFWRHVCALQSVARHEPLNAEFHAHIKQKLDGVQGASFKAAPLKGYDRVAVKAEQYHKEMGLPDTPVGAGAAAARVIDIVRCSFEVPSALSALALCAWLDAATLEEHGVRALRRKNGFHADAPSAGGYRDIKYNLLYQSPTVAGAMGRAVVEVQIILEAYLKVKMKMHAVYRVDRGDFG
jgi:hypothetical protein